MSQTARAASWGAEKGAPEVGVGVPEQLTVESERAMLVGDCSEIRNLVGNLSWGLDGE